MGASPLSPLSALGPSMGSRHVAGSSNMYSEQVLGLEAEWDQIWDLPLTVCDLGQVSIHVSWLPYL